MEYMNNCDVICKFESMTLRLYEYLNNTETTDVEQMKKEIIDILYLPSLEDFIGG